MGDQAQKKLPPGGSHRFTRRVVVGYIREDGRHMYPMYLLPVKTPAESKEEWEVFNITATIPAERAFRHALHGITD